MSDLKIILLCGSRFALAAMNDLSFFQVLGAVGIPSECDEMLERVEPLLAGSNIPVIVLEKNRFAAQLTEAISDYQITMGLVMTLSYKIPESVYSLTPLGFFNVHPGPLPEYRGADPIFQQIKNKEPYAAVTIHQLSQTMDAGPVTLREKIRLDRGDTHGLLTTKLSQLASTMCSTLARLAAYGLAIPSRTQDETKAQYFPKQGGGDITIDWERMEAAAIIALINACNPWNKGAVTKINHRIIRFLEATKVDENSSAEKRPGYILAIGEKLIRVSTYMNQALDVSIVYADEGYISGDRLAEIGVHAGEHFENI